MLYDSTGILRKETIMKCDRCKKKHSLHIRIRTSQGFEFLCKECWMQEGERDWIRHAYQSDRPCDWCNKIIRRAIDRNTDGERLCISCWKKDTIMEWDKRARKVL